MEEHGTFIVLALLAEILGTISGFGSSILLIPIASMFFDFKSVLGIVAVLHVFSNLSKIFLFRQGIDRNIVFKLGLTAIAAVIVGAMLNNLLPVSQMVLLMNIGLVLLSIYLLVNFNKKMKQTDTNLYIGGTASGLLAGLLGTGGAIRGLTLAAFQLPKSVFIATSAIIDLGVDFSRAVIYLWNGYFHSKYIVLIPFLIGVSVLGSYIGKVILKYVSELMFRYLVLVIVVGVSAYQVWSYLE